MAFRMYNKRTDSTLIKIVVRGLVLISIIVVGYFVISTVLPIFRLDPGQ